MAELAVKNLRKSFGQNEVLKGVSFTVESGKFLSLLGPSGCGKSTILRIICGLETPNSGEVLVDGTDVTTVRPEKRNIGMVFQNYEHPILPALREQGLQYNMPIHIGRNCWLGAGVIVLPGVTVGDNTVIGAGSVVTRDIPANVVAVGNPCRVLRPIGEKDREYYFRGRRIPEELKK